MKKIEKKSKLQVTFSKRRTGLFKKAAELHLLCGAEVAIFVQSPAKRVFVFGSSPPDSVIRRYLDGVNGRASFCPNPLPQHHHVGVAGELEGKGSHGNSGSGDWLEEELSVDLELSLEEAEKYLATTETPLPQYGYLDGANRETSFCPNPLPQNDHKYVEVAGRLEGKANETVNQGFVEATSSSSGSGNSICGVNWFDEEVNVEELCLEEAEKYLAALETLRNNVLNRANDLKMARAFM